MNVPVQLIEPPVEKVRSVDAPVEFIFIAPLLTSVPLANVMSRPVLKFSVSFADTFRESIVTLAFKFTTELLAPVLSI